MDKVCGKKLEGRRQNQIYKQCVWPPVHVCGVGKGNRTNNYDDLRGIILKFIGGV